MRLFSGRQYAGRLFVGRQFAGQRGDATTAPGGWFRRPLWSWVRLFARGLPTLDRVWRYQDVPNTMPARTLTKAESDDRVYGFDLSAVPELAEAGVTVASAAILGGTGLTVGTPAVSVAEFDAIPAGKAVLVRISGGTDDDTYTLACAATLSTGRVVVVPGRMVVTGDY